MKSGIDQSVYDQIVKSLVMHLQQNGFSTVRANTQGFAQPSKVQWDELDEGVVPDITGEHKGSIYVFEIETRDAIKPQMVEDRWRLLSIFAKRNNGKFYLVTPETKMEYLQGVIEDLDVEPEFLRLTGIE